MSTTQIARPVTVFEASASHFRRYRAVKKQASARYLQAAAGFSALAALNPSASPKPEQNVVGVGIGEKTSNGIST
ncbi:MAG: hypothetical protein ACRD3J_23000, partial [Thermoanaerobaculia bacterium]